MRGRGVSLAAVFILAVIFGGSALRPGTKEDKDSGRMSGPGLDLRAPALVWTKLFPEEVKGAAMACRSGAVAAHTENLVYYLTDRETPVWIAGDKQGWKHVEGLGINWEGDRVLFQTDRKPKTTTEGMDLTVHLLDGRGRELWAKPNPYRWESTILSPSGKYILFGECFHATLKCHDQEMNLLWQKNIQIWYVAFDPQEHFLFDGEGGILYTIEGEQVWDFGRYTRILSVSDDAQYVMTQFYRHAAAQKQIFLISRPSLRKIELAGTGGAVSPDGTFTAYVNAERELVVYRTEELIAEGGPSSKLKPLFKTDFVKPWVINLARDNRSLFVLGQKSEAISVIMLVDLGRRKKAWEKPVDHNLRLALPTINNEEVVIKSAPNALTKYRCY